MACRGTGEGAPNSPIGGEEIIDLAEITGFLYERLAEDADSAELFHEMDCPGAGPTAVHRCDCPTPADVLYSTAAYFHIVEECEDAVARPDHTSADWPLKEQLALATLRALTLSYELHPGWREDWRP